MGTSKRGWKWKTVRSFFLKQVIFSNTLSQTATREATRVYQLITNDYASFHLWWKENLRNHQKVSNYYEHDCLQNFLLLFMSLLTALIVRNSHTLDGIYFIFLKNALDQISKAFYSKFGPQWKDRESSYQVRQILAFLCKSVALIPG